MSAEPHCRFLPLDRYPGINPLALDMVHGNESATRFFQGIDGGAALADRRSVAAALRESNATWGNDVGSLLEEWAEGRADVVIAGQQVGFGGGPLYTLVKLASLLNIARDATGADRSIIPFFWLATEDHDFDEVARLNLQLDGRMHVLRAGNAPAERLPVGDLPIPEQLRSAVIRATGLPAEGWLESGLSFRESFARLITSVAGGRIVLVDAMLPELRRAGQELFATAAERYDDVQQAVAASSEEIERAGYRVQVQPSDGPRYTLFYQFESNGARTVVTNGDQLRRLSEAAPESISTAALMRPLLQDFVFAPTAFIGGPAEVAYYAQLEGTRRLLDVHRPRVMLRAHALVLPERFAEAMDRYGVEPDEWLDSPETILARREREREAALAERVELLRAHFDDELGAIRESILKADPSLTRSLNRTVRRIDYHLDVLGRRGRRVIARSDQERFSAVERLANVLRPNGVVQDRVVGWLSYWLLWGDRTLESIIPFAEPGTDRLSIIGIR